MMRRVFLFCTLLIFGFTCRAQFFALEFDSVSPYVTALPYPMDSYYRVVSYDHSFPATPVNRTRIKVYDSAQQYVRTIYLLKGITLVNDYPPLLYNQRLLWPANFNDTVEHARNSLVILELDTNYNFIALHKLSTHNGRAIPTGIVRYSNGFVVGEYFNGLSVSSTGFSTKLYKLGLNLGKRDSVLLPDELRLKTHISGNDKIVGASDDISAACTPTSPVSQKITLDTNLAITDCFNIPASMIYFCYDDNGNMSARYAVRLKRKSIIFPLSNYRTYVHGEADNNNCPPLVPATAIGAAVLKGNSHNNFYLNTNSPENTEFPLYLASDCDYFGANTIHVGVIGLRNNYPVEKSFYKPYYAKLKTKMTVTRLDTTGSLIWSSHYGGDMSYYARSVAFTADGGCVVAGSRYDSAAFYPNRVFENFLMKLDAQGNVINVGLKEQAAAMSKNIKCFPNPATEQVSFHVPAAEHTTVQIYNNMGQIVSEKKNYISLSAIDVRELEKGLYTFKIITTKDIYAGKLLKE